MKLSDIRKLCENASILPWSVTGPDDNTDDIIRSADGTRVAGSCCCGGFSSPDDAKFLVAATKLLPKLLAVAEAAKHAVDNGLWIEEQNIVVPELDGSSRKRIIKALEALESE